MKALRKGFLYAILLLVSLAVLALLAVNLYLRSPGIRQEVADVLYARYGVTVSYGSLSYLPGRGVKVRDVVVEHRPEISAITQAPFMHVDAVLAEVSLWSLVDRPVQIGEVRIVRPTITTLQWLDGSIAFPWVRSGYSATPVLSEVTDPGLEPGPEVSPPPADLADAGPELATSRPDLEVAGDGTGEARETTRPAVPERARVLLTELRLEGGAVTLLGPGGTRALCALRGIDCRIDFPSFREGVLGRSLGEMSIARGDVMEIMRATAIESKVQLRNDGALALPQLRGVSDGGTLEGSVIMDPRRPGLPFHVKLVWRSVGVAPMSRRAAPRMTFSRGALEGTIDVEGLLSETRTWRGQGELLVKEAAMARNSLLESFGRYVGLREFVEPAFEEAKASFQVKGPVIWFDDIHWKTENLEFKALGAVGMNQNVRLAARLYFSRRVHEVLQRIERQLPERVVRRPAQLEGRDDYYRDFVISGPVHALRANFIGSEGRTFEEVMELLRAAEEETKKNKG